MRELSIDTISHVHSFFGRYRNTSLAAATVVDSAHPVSTSITRVSLKSATFLYSTYIIQLDIWPLYVFSAHLFDPLVSCLTHNPAP